MKATMLQLFGEGEHLEWYQMAVRALAMFCAALVLVRVSGRRSFGMKSPFDNTIAILLGAVLSRGVVGASPFLSTCAAGAVLVILHRVLAWAVIKHKGFAKLVRGKPILLFKEGRIIHQHMDKSLICEEELLENLRTKANVASFDDVSAAYLETTGEIGVVKKR